MNGRIVFPLLYLSMYFCLHVFQYIYFGTADMASTLNPTYIECVCVEDFKSPPDLWAKISKTPKQAVYIYSKQMPHDQFINNNPQADKTLYVFLDYIVRQSPTPIPSSISIHSFLQKCSNHTLFKTPPQ